jgi:ubiquinone/menaquinone biosynthesis C-methylase UbiE
MNIHPSGKSDAQRLDEWQALDARAFDYHRSQWDHPKESTIAFNGFIAQNLVTSRNVLDLGAGAGAATAFLAKNNLTTVFTAFDYSHELVEIGKQIAVSKKITNLNFAQGDWYNLKVNKNSYDGCISLQTLSWLPDYEEPLVAIFKNLDPDWIGLTSLFYDGDITCRIEVEEHTRSRKTFYNVYSIPAISRLCEQYNYTITKISPFVINKDIQKPKNPDLMSTYTKRCLNENSAGL